MFAATVSSNRTMSWLTSATLARTESSARSRRSTPSSLTWPFSGSWNRGIRPAIVVLPRAAIALEWTACGIYTVGRGDLKLGETVVVLGGGFLGLIMVQVACLEGAGRIRLDPIVTHNIPLREYRRAVDVAHRRLEHAIKVSMTP